MTVYRPDDESLCVEVTSRRMDDGRTHLMLRDVSARVRAEQAARDIAAHLSAAQRTEAIGELAGGVAHDFNNLLTVINTTDDPSMRRDLEAIHAAGQRAAMLTQQLLAFSRKQILAPKVLRVNTVLSSMHGMLRRLVRENITRRLDLAPDAGNVIFDRGQLEQITLHLAVNAAESMPESGVLSVTTAVGNHDEAAAVTHARDGKATHVILRIHDTRGVLDA